ncbi:MAG: GIY-YIG nuclease family protein [Chitinophagaceae bacterium]|nr:GIY-YIG nuclease family protein [Chitinophagaceae bacterium]MCW5928566.1 GIY-YIG nuclease family protein [Chitinophagaceae bacterium]
MPAHHPSYYVYILTNFTRTVLYTGITNNLQQRIIEHYLMRGNQKIFTGRYNCFYLLYYEDFRYVNDAIAREKEIKGWSRAKKVALIQSFNVEMKFLNDELFDEWPPKEMFHRKDLQ